MANDYHFAIGNYHNLSEATTVYGHLPTWFEEQLFPLWIGGFALSKEEAIYLTKG